MTAEEPCVKCGITTPRNIYNHGNLGLLKQCTNCEWIYDYNGNHYSGVLNDLNCFHGPCYFERKPRRKVTPKVIREYIKKSGTYFEDIKEEGFHKTNPVYIKAEDEHKEILDIYNLALKGLKNDTLT